MGQRNHQLFDGFLNLHWESSVLSPSGAAPQNHRTTSCHRCDAVRPSRLRIRAFEHRLGASPLPADRSRPPSPHRCAGASPRLGEQVPYRLFQLQSPASCPKNRPRVERNQVGNPSPPFPHALNLALRRLSRSPARLADNQAAALDLLFVCNNYIQAR